MKKVMILGAGIAGLAAAHELAQKQIPVEIIESADQIGGLAKNTRYKGFTFDMGPHRVYSESPDTMQLIKELCGHELLNVPRKSRIRIRGRYYDYPPQVKELLFNLPPDLWLKFITGFLLTKMTPPSKLPDDSHYEGYLIRRFGKPMSDFFFLPYAQRVWGISPREISADIAKIRLAHKNFTETLKEIVKGPSPDQSKTAVQEFYYPKKGIGMIADALADRVKQMGVVIHCNTKVTGITLGQISNGWSVNKIVCESNKDKLEFDCDRVISTIPLSNLILSMHPRDNELIMSVKGLRHRSILLVCLLIRKPQITQDHWLYFPEDEFHITRIHQPKNFSSFLCPPGKSSLVAELTCFPDDHRWKLTDMEIYDLTLSDIISSGLVYETEIEDYTIVRIRHAYPVYDIHYQNKLNLAFEYLKSIDNLITAGRQGLFHHNNIDHSIMMGQAAARFIISLPVSSRDWYKNLNQFDRFRVVD